MMSEDDRYMQIMYISSVVEHNLCIVDDLMSGSDVNCLQRTHYTYRLGIDQSVRDANEPFEGFIPSISAQVTEEVSENKNPGRDEKGDSCSHNPDSPFDSAHSKL